MTYFTLPNSNHEGKGSPIEKMVCGAKVSPATSKKTGTACGRVVAICIACERWFRRGSQPRMTLAARP